MKRLCDLNQLMNDRWSFQAIKSKSLKLLLLSLVVLTTAGCNLDHKGGLDGKTQTLELTYIAWACDCANWASKEDINRYHDNIDNTLANRSIFIEPASQALELPDTLGYSNDIIKFTGQFYKEKGFPKGYDSFENPEESRVFRYTDYEVVISNFKETNPTIEKGVIEDGFEEIIDSTRLPNWAAFKYGKYEDRLEQLHSLDPTYLEADFTGDGAMDISLYVSDRSNDMKGILFLLGDSDSTHIVGCGNSFGPGIDNLEWIDFWKVVDRGLTQEITFLDNGDVEGSRDVMLKHSALSVREEEGSGGLIYYNGEAFIWIHQGD